MRFVTIYDENQITLQNICDSGLASQLFQATNILVEVGSCIDVIEPSAEGEDEFGCLMDAG